MMNNKDINIRKLNNLNNVENIDIFLISLILTSPQRNEDIHDNSFIK